MPALVAEAAWRYVEFFTANIRSPNTRRAYLRACNRFLGWCEDRGLPLAAIWAHDVATYVEELRAAVQAPSVTEQLAAIRMLFNWLVTARSCRPIRHQPCAGRSTSSRPAKRPCLKRKRGAGCSMRSRRRRCAICATGR